MIKQRASKLDQFAEVLMGMDAEKKTLAEMQAWLKAEGCTVSPATLSSWLSGERSRRLQAKLLAQIATGARTVREVEAEFAKNPAPGLETITKMLRVFILQLSTQANVQPELFELVNPLMKSVMDFAKLELAGKQTAMDERRLQLLEKKADAYDRAQAALTAAKSSKGGITKETLARIESELKLL
jgi:transcriptional regulator with XRE-family HTH domain